MTFGSLVFVVVVVSVGSLSADAASGSVAAPRLPPPTSPSSPDAEPTDVEPDPPGAPMPAPEPASEPEPEPIPEPEPAACDPPCPDGATCHEGQCLATCDPPCDAGTICVAGRCETSLEPPAPDPEPQVIQAPPLAGPEPKGEPEPEPEVEPGFGFRFGPGVAACMGDGCRDVRVGTKRGGMSVGGALDLRVLYRATRFVSAELGTIFAIHGNDVADNPVTLWFVAQAGPRLHLSGGKWRAEPILGMQIGWTRSLVRWTQAGASADALSLGLDAGVEMALTSRVSLGMLTSVVLPYWARVCEVDNDLKSCHSRSELTDADRERWFWVTGISVVARI